MADARLVKRDVGRDAEIERLRNDLLRQAQQLGRRRSARHATDRHVVEAERLQIHRVANAAKHFIGEHGRGYNFLAAALQSLRQRQYRGDTVARVTRFAGAGIAVVEIEETQHDAVGERRHIEARTLPAADDCRRLAARHHAGKFARDLGGGARVTAERATHAVDYQPLGLLHDFRRQVLIAKRGRIGAQ